MNRRGFFRRTAGVIVGGAVAKALPIADAPQYVPIEMSRTITITPDLLAANGYGDVSWAPTDWDEFWSRQPGSPWLRHIDGAKQ